MRKLAPLLASLSLFAVSAGCDLLEREDEDECGEHDDGDDETDETGEEEGTPMTKEQTLDEMQLGTHLVLGYDADSETFSGTISNTTQAPLEQVRVEVHLDNGSELEPSPELNLAAGEEMTVSIDAAGEVFDMWWAEAEVGEDDECE